MTNPHCNLQSLDYLACAFFPFLRIWGIPWLFDRLPSGPSLHLEQVFPPLLTTFHSSFGFYSEAWPRPTPHFAPVTQSSFPLLFFNTVDPVCASLVRPWFYMRGDVSALFPTVFLFSLPWHGTQPGDVCGWMG